MGVDDNFQETSRDIKSIEEEKREEREEKAQLHCQQQGLPSLPYLAGADADSEVTNHPSPIDLQLSASSCTLPMLGPLLGLDIFIVLLLGANIRLASSPSR